MSELVVETPLAEQETVVVWAEAPAEDLFLVIFRDNWAGEIDMEGFAILDQEQADALSEAIETVDYPHEWVFGEGDQAAVWNDEDELRDCLSFNAISRDDAERFIRLLSSGHVPETVPFYFGHFPELFDRNSRDWLE